HHESVSACAHDGEQIAFAHFRHFAIERKKVSALANRPDNVDLLVPRVIQFTNWNDLVVTMVKCGSNQIIHSRIDNREFLWTGTLDVTNPRQQKTSVSHEQSPWFDQNPQF